MASVLCSTSVWNSFQLMDRSLLSGINLHLFSRELLASAAALAKGSRLNLKAKRSTPLNRQQRNVIVGGYRSAPLLDPAHDQINTLRQRQRPAFLDHFQQTG